MNNNPTGSSIVLFVKSASCFRWASLILLLLCPALPAWADYRLGAGDELEISVVGVPELRRSVTIETDGRISYPLMGSTLIAGLSLADTRALIKATLGSKIYRQKTPDGLDKAILIEPDDITVTVARYRPIYVKGDVLRPGEYTFRPDLTVRQAIALAGGYNVLGVRTKDPFITLVDLKSEQEVLWVEFAKEKARIWRINVEIGGTEADKHIVSQSIPKSAPIPRSTKSRIFELAANQLENRQMDYGREQAFVRRSTAKLDEQITVLSAQEKKEQEGFEFDNADLQKLLAAVKKGIVLQSRLSEARRAVLFSSTRKLQITAQLIELKGKKDRLLRQLEKFSDDRKLQLNTDLEAATLRLVEIESKLRSIGEKIRYIANLKSQHTGGDGGEANIIVYRKDKTGSKRLSSDEAFVLEPGDLVEVRSRLDNNFLDLVRLRKK